MFTLTYLMTTIKLGIIPSVPRIDDSV